MYLKSGKIKNSVLVVIKDLIVQQQNIGGEEADLNNNTRRESSRPEK